MYHKSAQGILNFKVGDKLYTIADEFEYDEGGWERELIEGGLNGNCGFTVKWRAPYVETSVVITGDMLASDITNNDDITITAEEQNGKVIVFNSCFFEGSKKFSPLTGKLKSKFTSTAKQPAQVIRRS